MLYKFQCKKAADVLMLEDLTSKIFAIIGRPLEPRGIFLLEQLPIAIAKLEAAIAEDLERKNNSPENTPSESSEESGHSINHDRLGQRAYPFINLLKEALLKKEMVSWGV
ncbi:MAG: hypothetical protein RLZZ472_1322 [Pseudomonadota bacterium]|jgi:hypothetical protein